MGVLRDRMAVDLRLRGMSPVTQRMYLGCVQRIRYPRRVTERLPDILSPGEVEQLLGTMRAFKHRDGSMNPVIRLCGTQGTPSSPENPGRFSARRAARDLRRCLEIRSVCAAA